MMTTTQIFPLGGSYVSGLAPVTTHGSYTGISGTATIGTYVSTNVERDHIPGRYTDTAPRCLARGPVSFARA
jgi:hypothetical protein